jgi:hypothetical protein
MCCYKKSKKANFPTEAAQAKQKNLIAALALFGVDLKLDKRCLDFIAYYLFTP